MARVTQFNSPFLLGFDELEALLDRTVRASSDGYPPYNIEQIGDDGLRISLAVAGFSETELNVVVEHRQLTIRGKQAEDNARTYLHRGIAARQFQRSFVLAEGIEIDGAWLDNGLLHVDLTRPRIKARTRIIPIKSNAGDAPDKGAHPLDVEVKG
jgi:HSP20 family molecular chaperone IbpA